MRLIYPKVLIFLCAFLSLQYGIAHSATPDASNFTGSNSRSLITLNAAFSSSAPGPAKGVFNGMRVFLNSNIRLSVSPRDSTLPNSEDEEANQGDTSTVFFNPRRFYVGGRQPVKKEKEPTAESYNTASDRMQVAQEGKYYVIVGSIPEETRALHFLERLNDEEAFIVYQPGEKRYRITKGSFENLPAAQQVVESITAKYEDAWIAYYDKS